MTYGEKYQVMVKIKFSDLPENEKAFVLESMLASLSDEEANLAAAGLAEVYSHFRTPPAEVA
ncbi:hypothetical protein LQM11_003086 [Vibrio parahaemolyticus]|nr:hypothetical protein [Vibrio parahaemolyticus]